MTTNANGQRMKLFTPLGAFDTAGDARRAEWSASIQGERQRQIEKWGYDAAHDAEHGVDHLLLWAQEYARIGKPLESAALIEAARELLTVPAAPVVPEQPQLPTTLAGAYGHGYLQAVKAIGGMRTDMRGFINPYADADRQFVPAGSEREAVIGWIEKFAATRPFSEVILHATRAARIKFALVPEAEEEK